jgi:hypothetical protein
LLVNVGTVSHRVYAGFAIACGNFVVRPVFLRPESDATGSSWNRPLRAYEHDFDYMCLKFVDPNDGVSKWFCGAGDLAEGVVGVATKNTSPRTFFVNNLSWGSNSWDHHWEFPSGLGSIASRIDPAQQTGFAQDDAWNLNPNDYHSDGSSKALEYIAAVNVKTQTNRNGVKISPFNTANIQDYIASNPGYSRIDPRAQARLRPGEMNQGEAETRSCGTWDNSRCFNYFQYVDVLSNGRLGTGGADGDGNGEPFGVIDLKVSSEYVNMALTGTCSWQSDWNLPQLQSAVYPNVVDWSAFPYNGQALRSLRLPTSSYKVAVSRGSLETQRCPSWHLCSTQTGSHDAFMLPYDASWNLLPSTAVAFTYNSLLPSSRVGVATAAMGFLCGQPVAARRVDSAKADWWICAGAACNTSAGSWQPACENTSACTISMSDQDLYVVSVPPSPPADPTRQELGWAVKNAGL